MYIVTCKYACERLSDNMGGLVSRHRSLAAAWRAAHAAHTSHGGCPGSDLLATVWRVVSDPAELRRIAAAAAAGEPYTPAGSRDLADVMEIDGHTVVECSIWDGHEVVVQPGGLGHRVRAE